MLLQTFRSCRCVLACSPSLPSLPQSPHGTSLLSVSQCLLPLRTLAMAFSAHMENPGQCPLSQIFNHICESSFPLKVGSQALGVRTCSLWRWTFFSLLHSSVQAPAQALLTGHLFYVNRNYSALDRHCKGPTLGCPMPPSSLHALNWTHTCPFWFIDPGVLVELGVGQGQASPSVTVGQVFPWPHARAP